MLKEEKGITLIALIVTIVVLIILAGITITGTIQGVDQAKNNTLLANLDMIHHAITERETKYKLTKDSSLLVGTKVDISSLTDVPSEIEWKVVQFDGLNNPEREYYRLSSTNLKELGLSTEVSNSASYIVNYYTGEVYNETDKKTSDNKVLYVE
ncbi:MAG: type II secretion system protein [Clostridia bacterium]|nr:type II secretion system protein [Clostridia bacterium]